MKFVIDDGRAGLPSCIPSLVQKVIAELDRVPDGKLLTTAGLAQRMKRTLSTLSHHTGHPALRPYKWKFNQTLAYFGNPQTIAAARKEYA